MQLRLLHKNHGATVRKTHKTSVFDRLEDSPVGEFFRLYHDKSTQIVFSDIMSIIRSKTEDFISYKQKMIKIRLELPLFPKNSEPWL